MNRALHYCSSSRRMRLTFPFWAGSASIFAIAASAALSLADVGEHDDVGLAFALFRLALQQRVDRDLLVGEDAGDVGEHARFVFHAQAQVVSRSRSRSSAGSAGSTSHPAGRPGGHAVGGIGRCQAGDVNRSAITDGRSARHRHPCRNRGSHRRHRP